MTTTALTELLPAADYGTADSEAGKQLLALMHVEESDLEQVFALLNELEDRSEYVSEDQAAEREGQALRHGIDAMQSAIVDDLEARVERAELYQLPLEHSELIELVKTIDTVQIIATESDYV